ncbi:MAG TPA: SDR family NAD(P)-dependent oxidoreductase, partial [Bacteroidia bacterium]|nr:SDR family NAD(P)-dependent oxidoreductase [Bacteroidia bacterium]
MIQSYAIITGASKGIGRAIALELARRGYSLLLVARSATLLEETAALARKAGAAEVRPMALDLTKAESVTAVLQEVQRNNLPVNVLVNNAGYGAWGRFDTLSLEEQDAMMRINMHVPVELTHGLLPLLKSRQPAYILNVASTAAYQAV